MIGLLRNIVIVMLLLTLVYVILSAYARWKHRRLLSNEYETLSDVMKRAEARDEYIARGMKSYARSYRPKLFLGVFIIPSVIMIGLIWLAQYS